MKDKKDVIAKTESFKSLNKKFKKISKKPFFNTISANEKKVQQLSELSRNIDNSVLGIAPKRFIYGKDKKLEKLSELKYTVDAYKVSVNEELVRLQEKRQDSVIGKLIDAKNNVTGFLTKEIKPLETLKNSLIDKKYKDKTSEEILSMVYGKPKKEKKKKDKQDSAQPSNQFTDTIDTAVSEASEKSINTPAVAPKENDVERLDVIEDRLESIDKNVVLLSETINEVYERSIDNQDTAIDRVEKKETAVVPLSNQQQTNKEPEQKEGSFWSDLLGKLFSGWAASKIGLRMLGGAISSIAKPLISKAAEKLGSVINAAKEFAKNSADKIKNLLGGAKDFAKTAIEKLSNAASSAVNKGKELLNSGKDKVKDLAKSGMGKLRGLFGGAKDNVTKGAQKLSENVKDKSSSILKKMTKFTKVVPVLGTVIAAGTAISSAIDGYNNAGQILGKSDSDLSETEKLAAAAGAVVNDISFGFISPTTVAEKIVSVFGSDDVLTNGEDVESAEPAEKVNMEIAFDMTNASPEEKILIRKIQNVQQYIADDEALKRNETNADRIKAREESIARYKNELKNLYKEYNERFYNSIPDVNKDDSIIKIEGQQQTTVDNTRRFNRPMMPAMQPQSSANINYNINTGMEESNFRAMDMFPRGEL